MQDNREKIMLQTSWTSVLGNAVLSVLKIVAGLVSGSLAVLSDGLDSASDVFTSLVILVTTSIINRPPNQKYAFGREKAENIASTLLAFVIFFMGWQMLIIAVKKIFSGEEASMPAGIAIWVTLISIAGKLLLALYQFRQGKRVQSQMLQANAVNMRNDVIISIGVLLGLFFTFILKIPLLDSIVALLISLYIIYSAVGIFRDANIVLLDGIDDTTVYNKIIAAVEQIPGAYHPHRIRSRHIGNRYHIVLDIEVDGSLSLTEAHLIAQKAEDSIRKMVENVYDIFIHVEPRGGEHCAEPFGISKENLI
ncbi:MAG: cation diffusion facilitator family transporter [Dysgonamonadaceae bacterium]|jgi:cation diffusion facilitator family transporter|nr:cation diffusion facilitator family transporter [Dysgonamonadaceae bacterium]